MMKIFEDDFVKINETSITVHEESIKEATNEPLTPEETPIPPAIYVRNVPTSTTYTTSATPETYQEVLDMKEC